VHELAAERRPRACDPRPAAQRLARGARAPAAVRGPDDIWVEHRDKALEVAVGDRLRERSHGAIVLLARGSEARALALDVAAGARGKLTHRLGLAADHLGDVGERHVEHIVQHERRALDCVAPAPTRARAAHRAHREPSSELGVAAIRTATAKTRRGN
jgi:hypothetical protein